MEALQLNRKLLARKYDPDACYEEAIALRDTATPEEKEIWLKSPITKSLLLGIEGDIATHFLLWSGGAYSTSPNAEHQARGELKALNDMGETIRGIVE